MHKALKLLLLVFCVFVTVSIGILYQRLMMQHDYTIQAEVDCDPYVEYCFVSVCDSENGDECTGDPEADTTYYKFIHRNAQDIPKCISGDQSCGIPTCKENEVECFYTLCDDSASTEGAICNDPILYASEHLMKDEATEDSFEEEEESEETILQDEI